MPKRKLDATTTASASPAKRAGGPTGILKAAGTPSGGKTVAFSPPEQLGELVARLCQAGGRADELLGIVEGLKVGTESSNHYALSVLLNMCLGGLLTYFLNVVGPEPCAAAAAVGAQRGGARQEQRHAAGRGVRQGEGCTV